MAYSRKRYWLALGAALILVPVLAVILQPHLAAMALMVAGVCGAMGFLAYFSLDEIQRQNEMRAWYHGGLLAILFGLLPLMVLISSTALEAVASRMAPDALHPPKFYFALGAGVALVVQAIGSFSAQAVSKIAGRGRR